MTIKLEGVLAALDQIATIAPAIAAASGLATTPLLTEIAAAIPEVHTMLDTLLALFQKHAANLVKTPSAS